MEEDKYVVLAGDDESPPHKIKEPLNSMCDEIQALWTRTNHNVKFILVIVAFAGLSESLTFGSALASYLYMATGDSNVSVGYLESALGLSKLLTALPMGDLADRYGREPIGKVGSFAYVVATAMTAYAIAARATSSLTAGSEANGDGDGDGADDATTLGLWCAALCLWGFGKGVVDGPVLALFADSVPTGDRSTFYYYLFLAFWFGALAGPLVGVLLFLSQSNSWTFPELASVILVGCGFKVVNAVLLCFLKDSEALGAEADHIRASASTPEATTIPEDGGSSSSSSSDAHSPNASLLAKGGEDGSEKAAVESETKVTIDERESSNKGDSNESGGEEVDSDDINAFDLRIPRLVFAASLISQLGSGMTVKYFPLFFMVDCGFSPAGVQGVYLLVPVAMLFGGSLGEKLAKQYGRVPTTAAFKAGGALSLALFCFLQRFVKDSNGDTRTPWVLALFLVPPFLLSTALTDATFPLEESLLMDHVPASQRGRWKSLESVTAFGWCGSAVMGGWLVDQYDYGATFFATALVQACAVLVWLSLAPLVSNKELRAAMPAPLPTSDLPASVPESAKDSSDEVQSPLYQPTTEARKPMDTMAIAERFSE